MKRPITFLLFAALLLIVAPMTVADDELSPEATDAPSAKTGQICLQMTQTGAFLVDGVPYVSLESTQGIEIGDYGWEIDPACFQLYGDTSRAGEAIYCSPDDASREVLIVLRSYTWNKFTYLLAKEDSALSDWGRYTDDFFGRACVDGIVTDASGLQPILEAHFHGAEAAPLDDQEIFQLKRDHGYTKISLEVKSVPGLWYTFYVAGDAAAYVYSRAAKAYVAVERPVTYRYGIVLPEYPADLPTMLEKAKAGAMNDGSGYWLDGVRLQAGPLVYERSLMIPLKAYLDALPCGAAWDDGGVSLQNRDGTVLYRIELRETPIRFSLPKDRVKESAALIQRDGTWYIDFWAFQTLLRDLSIGYETVIDTEQGVFQIRLTDQPERYLLSSINGLA